MTIAIGIRGTDGMVMAADTQVSTGGDLKGSQSKLLSFASHDADKPEAGSLAGICVVSGAGDSGYVQALTEELGFVFLDNPKLMTMRIGKNSTASLRSEFLKCLQHFYKQHVIPFASFPARDRPEVEMLLGVYRHHILAMFSTEKTTINHVSAYKAIGIGATFAELLLDRLWKSSSVNELEVLAAYVMFLVKESVEGCGKYTQIITINGSKVIQSSKGAELQPPNPPMAYVPWNVIDTWERSFRTDWAQSEHSLIWELIGQYRRDLPSTRGVKK